MYQKGKLYFMCQLYINNNELYNKKLNKRKNK